MPTIAELEEMVKRFPGKPFPHYGLAMELRKAGRLEEAIREFDRVVELDPNYAAAHHQAGMAWEAAGKLAEAKGAYEKGVLAARRAGNAHAADEIGAALQALTAKGA